MGPTESSDPDVVTFDQSEPGIATGATATVNRPSSLKAEDHAAASRHVADRTTAEPGRNPRSPPFVHAPDSLTPPPALPQPDEIPVVLSVFIEADGLLDTPPAAAPIRSTDSEANRSARVAARPATNDIASITQTLEIRTTENPSDLGAQLRLKLAYLLAGREQDAMTPPQGLPADLAALIQAATEAFLMTQRACTNLDTSAEAALESVLALAGELRSQVDLDIPRVALCQRVDSYGQFLPIEPANFAAGSPIAAVVYVELTNFQSRPNDAGLFETLLAQRLELLDADGRRVWQRQDDDISDLCHNPRHDFFLAPIVQLPEDLPTGRYHLRVEIHDRIANKFASRSAELAIGGPIGMDSSDMTGRAAATPSPGNKAIPGDIRPTARADQFALRPSQKQHTQSRASRGLNPQTD